MRQIPKKSAAPGGGPGPGAAGPAPGAPGEAGGADQVGGAGAEAPAAQLPGGHPGSLRNVRGAMFEARA